MLYYKTKHVTLDYKNDISKFSDYSLIISVYPDCFCLYMNIYVHMYKFIYQICRIHDL